MPIVFKTKRSMVDSLTEEEDLTNELIRLVQKAPNNLMSLYDVYYKSVLKGVDMSNVDCRCNDPLTALPGDIYLGDIKGIWTNNINTFEKLKDKEPEVYQTVAEQFRKQITSSLKQHRSEILDSGVSRERLSANIIDAANKFFVNHKSEFRNEELKVVKCSILDGMINPNSIVHLDLKFQNGYETHTSGIITDRGLNFYLPDDFYRGVELTPKDVKNRKFADLYELANNKNGMLSVFKTDISNVAENIKVNSVGGSPDYCKRSEVKKRYLDYVEKKKSKGLTV